MKYTIYSLLLIVLVSLMGCQPYVEEKSELGALPNASFEIIPGATPNEFILRNTTPGTFLTKWDLGDFGTADSVEAQVSIPRKGDYEITMTTFNQGGHASITKTVTVTQDDPNGCQGNIKLLTDCGEKTWKLAPEEGAMFIGPDLTSGTTWWANGIADVATRACHFNNEYTFRSNGEFQFDTKDDFWADTDGNGNVFPADLMVTEGCHPTSDLPAKYQSWGSGLHQFTITPTSLTVSGEGAWMGLYKAGTDAEVGEPQQSITYTIIEITETRLVIATIYSWGVWRFTFVAQ
jgi:PKD repeat protein